MRTIKLVLIGDSGVGKTSLRGKYITGQFSNGYRATIGTDFITKTVPHHSNADEQVVLQIWDTAGQERFSSLSSAFFRGADAAVLMFDVNRPDTLQGLHKWWNEFKDRAPVSDERLGDYCCIVVGNKIDLTGPARYGNGARLDGTRVPKEDALEFLKELVPESSAPPSIYDNDRRENGGEMDGEDARINVMPDGDDYEQLGESSSYAAQHDESFELGSGIRPRTRSIDILRGGSSSNVFKTPSLKHLRSKQRLSKSRSTERRLDGTMTTTRTNMTLYHTPSSSLFDFYDPASASPSPGSFFHSPPPLNGMDGFELAASPSRSSPHRSTRIARPPPAPSIASTSTSVPTLTQSLFRRRSQTSIPSPPTPPPLPPPERGPKLFYVSAKTGDGVSSVFEYIAKRVVMRWEYEEDMEARTMHVREASSETIRLHERRGRTFGRFAGGIPVTCCSS